MWSSWPRDALHTLVASQPGSCSPLPKHTAEWTQWPQSNNSMARCCQERKENYLHALSSEIGTQLPAVQGSWYRLLWYACPLLQVGLIFPKLLFMAFQTHMKRYGLLNTIITFNKYYHTSQSIFTVSVLNWLTNNKPINPKSYGGMRRHNGTTPKSFF